MITCRELIDFLLDYLEGSLPTEQRAVFERHLAMCPECVNYLEEYKTAVRLGRAACCDDNPQPLPEGLVRAILLARKLPPQQ